MIIFIFATNVALQFARATTKNDIDKERTDRKREIDRFQRLKFVSFEDNPVYALDQQMILFYLEYALECGTAALLLLFCRKQSILLEKSNASHNPPNASRITSMRVATLLMQSHQSH